VLDRIVSTNSSKRKFIEKKDIMETWIILSCLVALTVAAECEYTSFKF